MNQITAAQARANSESSTHGATELLGSISSSISATSTTGATSITHYASKEAINETELAQAISTLRERGFEVDCITDPNHYTFEIRW